MLTFGTFTALLISTALILENGSWAYGYDSDKYLNIISCKGEYLIVDKRFESNNYNFLKKLRRYVQQTTLLRQPTQQRIFCKDTLGRYSNTQTIISIQLTRNDPIVLYIENYSTHVQAFQNVQIAINGSDEKLIHIIRYTFYNTQCFNYTQLS